MPWHPRVESMEFSDVILHMVNESTASRADKNESSVNGRTRNSIIRRFGFEDLKPISTPMDPQLKLSQAQALSTTEEHAVMRDVPYREAVGSLMYAALGTRPDIAFAITTLSRFASNPGVIHWNATKRVFRYLKGTRDLWLTFGGVKTDLKGWADADGSMAEDRHAISGYAFIIDGGAVSWSSKRQEIISLSTTESEYMAATHAAKEALWLRSLIGQIFPRTDINKDDATILFLTTNPPLSSPKTTNTMPVRNTSTSASILFIGSSRTALSGSSIAQQTT
jgi:hypothetical protein